MLNGKFYTGLPPKMMDRGCAGGRNRLESHLFWPDETDTVTVVESRMKRRNSVQLPSEDRPFYEKQNSAFDDVDTRKRFSKEFSQSSIQFFDNLNESNTHNRRPQQRNSIANKKNDITEKPTNTKLELPNNAVNDSYTAAKKKQAYTSKIEFYDYANGGEEEQKNQNNLRKPKMDMNNKREMELNSKNSPKLQIKRDVRSLSEEKEHNKMNNREMSTTERSVHDEMFNVSDQRRRTVNIPENDLRSRISVDPRLKVNEKRNLDQRNNNRGQHYSCEKEIYEEIDPHSYEMFRPKYYENFERGGHRRNVEEPNAYKNDKYSLSDYGKKENPQMMLRNNVRHYCNVPEYRNCYQDPQADTEVTNRMRNVSLRSMPSRKQYYPGEEYYDDEPPYSRNEQIRTSTNGGSSFSCHDDNDGEGSEIDWPYQNYNITPKRFYNNKSPVNKINNRFEWETLPSPTSPSPSVAESSVSTIKSQKHLRSSLCFNNGEIIGENDATTSPTSSHNPTQRRNARSSATQRVSVGLPD